MTKFISIIIILFGIFVTAFGGFWEIFFLIILMKEFFYISESTTGILFLYFMPIISMAIGGFIIWIGGKIIDYLWITKGWRIFFILLFICAGIFQIFLISYIRILSV